MSELLGKGRLCASAAEGRVLDYDQEPRGRYSGGRRVNEADGDRRVRCLPPHRTSPYHAHWVGRFIGG